jgi:uncharacterized membrane protein YagU involved in acid resistance
MNIKRLLVSTLVSFIVVVVFDYIVHHILLMPIYHDTAHLWRDSEQMQSLMPVMFLSQLLFAFAFVLIFSQYYENKGIAEGARYGLFIGSLLAALQLGTYVYMPVPAILTGAWMLSMVVWGLLAGVALALVFKRF